MDDSDPVTIPVHADTAGFLREVAAMRTELETGLGTGATQAGRSIETSLARAAATGKLGFEDLKSVALKALEQIAAASLRSAIGGSGGSGGGGLVALLGGLIGLPGRATGGPVAPGAAYVVGERGPELFVPTSSGRIETGGGGGGGGARDVRVAITVNAAAASAPSALAQSSRQVARAVKAALAD